MKFISGFIKHSLMPSRRLITNVSLSRHSDQTSAEFPSHEGLLRPAKTEIQTDQPLTTTSDFPQPNQGEHFNDVAGSTHQVPSHIAPGSEVSDLIDGSSPESKTTDASETVKSASLTQNLGKSVVGYKPYSISPEINDQNKSPEKNQSTPFHLLKNSPQGLSAEDLNTQNKTNEKHFSTKTSIVSKIQAKEVEEVKPVNQGNQTAQDLKAKQLEISTATPLNLTNAASTIDTVNQHANSASQEQEISIAVPIKRQAQAQTKSQSTMNKTSEGPAQSNRPKTVDTPQVRIGNINILVDDRAAVKPAIKTSSTQVTPPISFGLRGL